MLHTSKALDTYVIVVADRTGIAHTRGESYSDNRVPLARSSDPEKIHRGLKIKVKREFPSPYVWDVERSLLLPSF